MENGNIERQTYSREEAAAYLGIHVNTLDRSSIPRLRIARRVLFRRDTLDKVLGGEEMPVEGQRMRRPKCAK